MKENNLLLAEKEQLTCQATSTASSDTALTALSCNWSLVNEDIQLMPEFTVENVMQYFIYRKENDGLER